MTMKKEVFVLSNFVDGLYNGVRVCLSINLLKEQLEQDFIEEYGHSGSGYYLILAEKVKNSSTISELDDVLDEIARFRSTYRIAQEIIPVETDIYHISDEKYEESVNNLAADDVHIKSILISNKEGILDNVKANIPYLIENELNTLLEDCLTRKERDEG